jgi:hypothetical protein
MGTESTHQAFLSGQIQTRGNLLKAMQLTEVFTAAERIYPTIARQYGSAGRVGQSARHQAGCVQSL